MPDAATVTSGALVQLPDKGVRVARPTPEELRDAAEVRTPLETMAALRLSRDPHEPAMNGVREGLWAHLAAIESGDEATIAAEVEEHTRNSVDEVLRRLT